MAGTLIRWPIHENETPKLHEREFWISLLGNFKFLCLWNTTTWWCHWPFVWGIHRSLVNSLHKGQWCRALMFSLICVWINTWVNNCEAGDLIYIKIIASIFYNGHSKLSFLSCINNSTSIRDCIHDWIWAESSDIDYNFINIMWTLLIS